MAGRDLLDFIWMLPFITLIACLVWLVLALVVLP